MIAEKNFTFHRLMLHADGRTMTVFGVDETGQPYAQTGAAWASRNAPDSAPESPFVPSPNNCYTPKLSTQSGT